MAFNMARWKVQANNLYLPYADLDAAGSVGRLLTIPDDVSLSMAYPVLMTPRGFSIARADIYGNIIANQGSVGWTQGYSNTFALAGNATQVVVVPFRAVFFNVFNVASTLRITATVYDTNTPFIAGIGTNAASSFGISAATISVLNTTATATTVTVNAFNV